MTELKLTTFINAPVVRCFDLSRSIELHLMSTKETKEKVVAGRVHGLVELGDTVTWEAVHFGIKQRLTTRITELKAPAFFKDVMTQGAFKSMAHEHHFVGKDGGTVMDDVFRYETPYGIFGRLFDVMALKRHMLRFLEQRNTLIKSMAEGG